MMGGRHYNLLSRGTLAAVRGMTGYRTPGIPLTPGAHERTIFVQVTKLHDDKNDDLNISCGHNQ